MSEEQNETGQISNNQQETIDEELEDYIFVKTLGKGNFGKVKLGTHKITNQPVAIKILEKDLIFEKTDIERISREIKIMKLVRHPHIIQLYEIIQTTKRLYLIMEFGESGDLFDLIVKNQKLKEDEAAKIYSNIILGLEYLHRKGVTHRDLKPQNILISGGKIKICDFGLGNFFVSGEKLQTACGSPCYASPEMLQKNPYNPQKVDIWSSGIILYAMVCGFLPFEDEVTTKLYEKIKNNKAKFPRHLSENVKGVLRKILQKQPDKRISTSELKDQAWLKHHFAFQKIQEFEVENWKVKKISELYDLDEEKLTNYLKKNKHNNLTTLYYLAAKKQFREGSEPETSPSMEKVEKTNEISFKNLVESSENDSNEKSSVKQRAEDSEKRDEDSEIQAEKEDEKENDEKEDEKSQKNQKNQKSEKQEKKQRKEFGREKGKGKEERKEERKDEKIVETEQKREIKKVVKKNSKVEDENQKRKNKQEKKKISPKLRKNERIIIEPSIKNKDKSIVLYERSSSKNKPIAQKKILFKALAKEPYLINPNYVVACSWKQFHDHLVGLGGEGKVEYFKYDKNCIYVVKSSVRGTGNLVSVIQKLNASL